MDADLEAVLGIFADEVKEGAAAAAHGLERMAGAQKDERREIIEALYRSAHTWRGNAGMFEFSDVERVAHAMMEALRPLRDGVAVVPPSRVAVLAEAIAWVERRVEAARAGGPLDEAGSEALAARLR